ncbi:MAG TPA: FISUMP domain-containing protein [bacterium]|nr:FISUMP domain-containing protein [bacterium]
MNRKLLIVTVALMVFSVSGILLAQAKISSSVSPIVKALPSRFSCGQSITDRDGYVYPTTQIGSQCWMAASLKTKSKPNGSCINQWTSPNRSALCPDATPNDANKGRSCYNNIENNCQVNGALYTWDAAMNGSTIEGAQGICPTGWHVPTYTEQYSLIYFYAKPQNVTNCIWINPANPYGRFDCSPAGTALRDSSGFNFKLGGERSVDGNSFSGLEGIGSFWSSLQNPRDINFAPTISLQENDSYTFRFSRERAMALSLRCIKDSVKK